ncbi:tetratricopeptide (TPR) repeat protein [Evansella vedderi]|uniref:Tetratricopeptide (TPR) repeat protein n=1 Tax=Evansella vedderi TaxID=38282 RepID=A0ABT9ZTS6_9BACI|nr:YkyA family protein [Evansella vedderi]MDQ0253883.1 tetratricopeptide (TPR) repeat protein [Evansella vedderi]
MNKLKISTITLVMFLLMVILAACSEEQPPNPAEFMYEHFEEAVVIERAVEEIQVPLTEAENNEFEWYEEMLALSDLEEIEALAAQAIESAEERRALMDEEKEIIDNAFQEFQQAIDFIEDFQDEVVKEQAEDIVRMMEERHQTYQDLYNKYMETIDMDIELYTLIYQEELTIEELQEKHDLVNEAYQQINELNNQFNEITAEFNNAKREFYENAGLEVVFEGA